MKNKKIYTIDYQEPFYILKEKKKWWIFPYNKHILYADNIDRAKEKMEELKSEDK